MTGIDVALWEIRQTLDQLGFDLSHGKYPASMLKDLKRTVDQLRLSLWAILEFEGQTTSEVDRSPRGLRKRLVEFRIKRLGQMLDDLRADLGKNGLEENNSDLQNLASTLQATLQSIARKRHHRG